MKIDETVVGLLFEGYLKLWEIIEDSYWFLSKRIYLDEMSQNFCQKRQLIETITRNSNIRDNNDLQN